MGESTCLHWLYRNHRLLVHPETLMTPPWHEVASRLATTHASPGGVITPDPVPHYFRKLKQEQNTHFFCNGDFNEMNLIAVQRLIGTSRNVLIENES